VPEVVNRAVIRAPAERIFAFVEQAERNAEWVPDLTVSERLTAGPTGVGTRFRFVTRIPGLPIPVESTDEVVAYEPGRLIRFASIKGVPHEGYWQLEPLPAGTDGAPQTRVTYAMSFELPPGIGPFVARMIDLPRRLDEQSQACLANLRQRLE
jgi:uncharacterized membrane protein